MKGFMVLAGLVLLFALAVQGNVVTGDRTGNYRDEDLGRRADYQARCLGRRACDLAQEAWALEQGARAYAQFAFSSAEHGFNGSMVEDARRVTNALREARNKKALAKKLRKQQRQLRAARLRCHTNRLSGAADAVLEEFRLKNR